MTRRSFFLTLSALFVARVPPTPRTDGVDFMCKALQSAFKQMSVTLNGAWLMDCSAKQPIDLVAIVHHNLTPGTDTARR